MRFASCLIAVSAAFTALPASAATVIDFDSLHTSDGGYGRVYGPYVEDGFTLTASRCPSNNNCFTTPQSFQSIDPTGASIITQFASTTSTLTKNDGGLFSIGSIDVAEYFDYGNFGSSADVSFSFVFADGSTQSETRTIDTVGRYPVNTLQFNVAPLRSFAFLPTRGTSGSLQFDNIVLGDDAVSAVPEPATWAMMLCGFGLLGGVLRRRSRKPGSAFPSAV